MRDRLGDHAPIQHMLEAIELVARFMHGRTMDDLAKDAMLRFATVKQLEIIGEAASRLTPGTIELEPTVQWRRVVLMRHVLVHDYYKIDVPTVWSTVQDDLKPLRDALLRLLEVLPAPGI